MKATIIVIFLFWILMITNVHCQCIDTVGHVTKGCEPKWSTFYETYPDSLFQIKASWWECICIKCDKRFTVNYNYERKLLWNKD